ncbi:MAG: DsrE family protein [Thioalkalispiraceae bacterium]|jgi:predicted peroxiredoxin
MPDKLMIVMVNTDPSNASEMGAPFFQATVAAAMDYEVEVIMTGRAGELAKKGFAEKLLAHEGNSKTIYDFIQEAYDAGAVFKVCTPTLEIWGDDLIPEISETVGAAYIISEAMSGNVVTFTY